VLRKRFLRRSRTYFDCFFLSVSFRRVFTRTVSLQWRGVPVYSCTIRDRRKTVSVVSSMIFHVAIVTRALGWRAVHTF